jgi:hypothetical protein
MARKERNAGSSSRRQCGQRRFGHGLGRGRAVAIGAGVVSHIGERLAVGLAQEVALQRGPVERRRVALPGGLVEGQRVEGRCVAVVLVAQSGYTALLEQLADHRPLKGRLARRRTGATPVRAGWAG